MSNTVLAFKLTSGEEVIAEVVEHQVSRLSENTSLTNMNGDYVVRRPHVLRFQPISPGQLGLAFVPWILSNPDIQNVVIFGKSLLAPPFEISAEVEKQYLQQTSGIQLAR